MSEGTDPAGGGGRRAVTAFFEDRAAAQAAIDDAVASGLEPSRLTLVEGGVEPVAQEAVPSDRKGFWQGLKDLFMADEDRHAYGEGLRRGGFLLSVETSAADHDRIVALLDRDGAIDIDARSADWTLEGWDPVRAAADLRGSAGTGGPLDGRGPGGLSDPPPRAGSAGTGTAAGPAVSGPTAIRDPGAVSVRSRAYVEAPAGSARGDGLG